MELPIPELSLVLLMGISGSGKSTFARRHFAPTEVLSSDAFRAMIADDENDQSVSVEAFEALYLIAAKRLAHGRLTVVDATNVQPEARRRLLALAGEYRCPAVAIVLDLPESLCLQRHGLRPDRDFPPGVIHRQSDFLRSSLADLQGEGFARIFVLTSTRDIRRGNDLTGPHGR